MSDSAPIAFTSPNFAFLAKYDDVLVHHAALAERYVFDDPNAALIKLRQFGELLAQHAAAYTGMAVEARTAQRDLIDQLWDGQIINAQVSQLFHGLRQAGNQAVHQHTGDRREALHQLQMARKLAIWFHKSFGGDKHFKAGAFVPPPDPRETERVLRTELERLREALVATQDQMAGTEQLVEEHARQRQAAEVAATRAYDDLRVALELAAETEQQLEHERQQFQQRLAELQARAAATPAAQRAAVVELAQYEAEELDLDEAQTRRIIDTQLREAGWEADTQMLRYAAGTRPARGRNLAIAEWPTAHGPADYVLFVGLTPVAVVEAKRRRLDAAGAIEQAKRYSHGYTVGAEQQSPGGPWDAYQVPFLFATNGRRFLRQIAEKSGIWFLDARQDTNHPCALEAWYTPGGLSQLLQQDIAAADTRLAAESTHYLPLRHYQEQAVRSIERCIAEGQRELLVAMATGTGKTITCIGLIYRLIKTRRFRRILFLVDRTALGEQASDKLKDVRLENLQTFPDIYDVKELGDLRPDPDTRLHIATVQGMIKRILYASDDAQPVPVDWYDCVIIDECHRGYTLDQALEDVKVITNPTARAKAINDRADVWKALRETLAELRKNKCWYCESDDARSDRPIDHYRPKNAIAECDDHDGYWWLAFSWDNFRYCCTFCNSHRVDKVHGTAGGKHDHFPIWKDGSRATFDQCSPDDLEREKPMLLDPCCPTDPPLLWFDENGKPAPNPHLCGPEGAFLHERVMKSIVLYHLDHHQIVDRRRQLYETVKRKLANAEDKLRRWGDNADTTAQQSLIEAVEELKSFMSPGQPYSATAKCAIMALRGSYTVADLVLHSS